MLGILLIIVICFSVATFVTWNINVLMWFVDDFWWFVRASILMGVFISWMEA